MKKLFPWSNTHFLVEKGKKEFSGDNQGNRVRPARKQCTCKFATQFSFSRWAHLTRSTASLKSKIWNVFFLPGHPKVWPNKTRSVIEMQNLKCFFFTQCFQRFDLTRSTASLKCKIWNVFSSIGGASKDYLGRDRQRWGALVQYPYWPLTRVAYLGTQGLPPCFC